MLARATFAITVSVLAGGCIDRPAPTSDLLGTWEWTRGTNILGQGPDASGVHFHFLITTIQGDSVFGKVDSRWNGRGKCGSLQGLRHSDGHLSLALTDGDPPVLVLLEGRLRREEFWVDDARPAGGENILATDSWFVFTRLSADTNAGCLTRA